jgi:hypothetical protein
MQKNTRARLCWSNKTARAHLPLAGWSHGWCGGGVDDNNKIHPNAPFLDLEMLGEGGGNGASWWEGRVWAEMRTKMSNSAERQWTKQQEMSKIAKRDVCKLFC